MAGKFKSNKNRYQLKHLLKNAGSRVLTSGAQRAALTSAAQILASGNGALDGASRCVALRARAGGDATFEEIKKDVHVRRGFDASRAFEDPTVSVSSNRAG